MCKLSYDEVLITRTGIQLQSQLLNFDKKLKLSSVNDIR